MVKTNELAAAALAIALQAAEAMAPGPAREGGRDLPSGTSRGGEGGWPVPGPAVCVAFLSLRLVWYLWGVRGATTGVAAADGARFVCVRRLSTMMLADLVATGALITATGLAGFLGGATEACAAASVAVWLGTLASLAGAVNAQAVLRSEAGGWALDARLAYLAVLAGHAAAVPVFASMLP